MKLTARTGRRLAGAGFAAAAIIVPVTALAAPGAPAARGASSDLAAPAASRCLAGGTEVWMAIPGNGAAGSIYYDVEVSNIGPVSCSL